MILCMVECMVLCLTSVAISSVNTTTKTTVYKNPKGNENNTDTKSSHNALNKTIPHQSEQSSIKLKNTAKNNKENREIKMIKITVYIIILSILSCIPPFLSTFFHTYFLLIYTIFFNNCGTPIIYLVADNSFRREVFKMFKRVE